MKKPITMQLKHWKKESAVFINGEQRYTSFTEDRENREQSVGDIVAGYMFALNDLNIPYKAKPPKYFKKKYAV